MRALVPGWSRCFVRAGGNCRAILAAVALFAAAEAGATDYGEWLQRGMAAGAAVSASAVIVSTETVLAQRAIGYADPPAAVRADAQHTAYRISSITKLFTAVALLQLLEDGLIHSLQDPVNRYLHDIRLPDNDDQQITIDHLVTHTAGFDYWQYGLYSASPADAGSEPLQASEVLSVLPLYARPPGQWAVYSNAGGSLLGYLVEQLTGLSLGEYLRVRLFEPLGMHATRLQGSGSVAAQAHSYYLLKDGQLLPQHRRTLGRFANLSMGAESSAADMGRFMRMLLRAGELGGVRVLSPASVALLFEERFRNHPAANGFGVLVDIAQQTPSIKLYMHNGATPGFNAHLLLAPEQNLAMFAVVAGSRPPGLESAAGSAPVLSAPGLLARFVRDWIAPYRFSATGLPAGGIVPTGDYLTEKRARRSPEALFDLFRPLQQISVRDIGGQYYSNQAPASEVAAGVFLGEGPYAYREMFSPTDDGPVMFVYGSNVLRPLSWWQQPQWLKYGAVGAAMATGLALLPLLPAWRRGERQLALLGLVGLGLLAIWPLNLMATKDGIAGLYIQVQNQQPGVLRLAVLLAHGWLLWALGFWMRLSFCCVTGVRLGLVTVASALLAAWSALLLLLVLGQLNLFGPAAMRWVLA